MNVIDLTLLSNHAATNKKLLQPVIVSLLSQYGYSEPGRGHNGLNRSDYVVSSHFGWVHIGFTNGNNHLTAFKREDYSKLVEVDHFAYSFIDKNYKMDTYLVPKSQIAKVAQRRGNKLMRSDLEPVALHHFKVNLSDYDTSVVKPPSRPDGKKSGARNPISDEERLKRYVKQMEKGWRGEEFIMSVEKDRLMQLGRGDLANRVKQVSLEDEAAGYDILSYFADGQEKFIEVKTTDGDENVPFYLSPGELRESKALSGQYFIYRVFNADGNNTPDYFVLSGDLETQLDMRAATYLCELRINS